jgi:hypothetical protein
MREELLLSGFHKVTPQRSLLTCNSKAESVLTWVHTLSADLLVARIRPLWMPKTPAVARTSQLCLQTGPCVESLRGLPPPCLAFDGPPTLLGILLFPPSELLLGQAPGACFARANLSLKRNTLRNTSFTCGPLCLIQAAGDHSAEVRMFTDGLSWPPRWCFARSVLGRLGL